MNKFVKFEVVVMPLNLCSLTSMFLFGNVNWLLCVGKLNANSDRLNLNANRNPSNEQPTLRIVHWVLLF